MKKRPQKPLPHSCIECGNAYCMRSDRHDPVVAECKVTKEREVASVKRVCRHFKPLIGEVEIHPMIYLK